jgi:hypothetical protein
MVDTILKNEPEAMAEAVLEGRLYTFRKLDAQDIAPLATIISKIGFKEFKECFDSPAVKAGMADGSLDLEKAGVAIMFDVVGIVIANIPKCIDDIFAFIASLTGMDIEEVKGLDLDVITEMIIELFQKEEFKKVFKVASKLFK